MPTSISLSRHYLECNDAYLTPEDCSLCLEGHKDLLLPDLHKLGACLRCVSPNDGPQNKYNEVALRKEESVQCKADVLDFKENKEKKKFFVTFILGIWIQSLDCELHYLIQTNLLLVLGPHRTMVKMSTHWSMWGFTEWSQLLHRLCRAEMEKEFQEGHFSQAHRKPFKCGLHSTQKRDHIKKTSKPLKVFLTSDFKRVPSQDSTCSSCLLIIWSSMREIQLISPSAIQWSMFKKPWNWKIMLGF